MHLKRSRVDENPTRSTLYLTDKLYRSWLWMPPQVFFRSAKGARLIFVTAELIEVENGDSAMPDAKHFLYFQRL
jgi:hypothetical protein